MATTIPQPTTLITHRGFFNYSALLQAARRWFVEEDFETLDMPLYMQKFPTPTGTEHEFKMKGTKNVTEYVQFKVEFFMRVYNMRDIEIIQDGKKIKLQEGQVWINVIPELVLDWQKRFEGAGPFRNFLKSLDDFYRNYIIKYTISDYWEDMVLIKAGQLARIIKETLGQEVI